MLVIDRILDILFPPRDDERLVRAMTDAAVRSCVSIQHVTTTNPATIALLSFAHPETRALIHEAKYRRNARAFAFLAAALHEHLVELSSEIGFGQVELVPIPLSPERLASRGYNQVAEVVKHVPELSVPISPQLLVRTRETVSQATLPRHARLENMRGAFIAAHPLSPHHTYLIVDDVLTTGATMQAAIDALRAGGAKHVLPLALAH